MNSTTEALTFEEFLDDPPKIVLDIFEDNVYEQADELSSIAYDLLFTLYPGTNWPNKAWCAYWDLYAEWRDNWMTDRARKEIEGHWEDTE